MKTLKEFKQQIREVDEEQVGELVNEIVNNCEPFLNEIDGQVEEYKLFRGMRGKGQFGLKSVRKDRAPSDTPNFIHEQIDEYFKENFGRSFRSRSIFTFGNEKSTETYGDPYVVFPRGNFEFLWSKRILDLFLDLPTKEIRDGDLKVEDFLKRAKYSNTNLKNAISSGNEIMIASNRYYYINSTFFEEWNLAEEIKDAYEF